MRSPRFQNTTFSHRFRNNIPYNPDSLTGKGYVFEHCNLKLGREYYYSCFPVFADQFFDIEFYEDVEMGLCVYLFPSQNPQGWDAFNKLFEESNELDYLSIE